MKITLFCAASLLCAALPGPVSNQAVPTEKPSAEAVAKLIAQLGATHFRSRQQASEELEKLGDPVLDVLRKAATTNVELEVKRRIERVVIRIEAASVEKLVRAYCAKQGVARDQVESWQSALAPEGRAFRYKLAAVPAKENQEALPEGSGKTSWRP